MSIAMVIGAGRGQIPIIDLCHKYGWKVVVVSPKGNYPGLEIADEIIYEDVKNHEDIYKQAEKLKVEAVLTDQLDVGVSTVAYVSEKLGIKSITYDTALKFTNKYIMRQEAAKAGINVPKSIIVGEKEKLEEQTALMNYPLMIKPVDSDASRGVYKIYSYNELAEKFESSKQYSKTGNVIVEEFIEGSEYVVEAFTSDYNPQNLIVGHRDYFNIPDTFIPNATVFTDANSAKSSLENRIKETNTALIKALKLPFGITHAEYLYNKKEDKIYLVEIAARGGGVFISSHLIPLACGVNANELLVKEILGIDYDKNIELKPGASAYFCYLTPQGTVTKLENTEKVESIQGVHTAFFDNIELGMKTGSIKDKSSRKGPILVYGESKSACYDVIENVKKVIDIEVQSENEIKKVIWHNL